MRETQRVQVGVGRAAAGVESEQRGRVSAVLRESAGAAAATSDAQTWRSRSVSASPQVACLSLLLRRAI